jgi:hypothetical protein
MTELYDVLAPFAKAVPNTAPAPDLHIYGAVTYLMPLESAMKTLGVADQTRSKKMVACPGFPYRSLFAYSFNGNFAGGFNLLYIVTDKVDQVVAVEFSTTSPEKNHMMPRYRKKEWTTYDFINTRLKAVSTAEVLHQTKFQGPDLLCVDSVFMAPDVSNRVLKVQNNRTQYGLALKPEIGTRLYLPRPLAELILHYIECVKAP